MSGYGETSDASKDYKGTAPTHDQVEEGQEMNVVNRRGTHSHRKTEIVQLNTADIYFKGDTPKLGNVLG